MGVALLLTNACNAVLGNEEGYFVGEPTAQGGSAGTGGVASSGGSGVNSASSGGAGTNTSSSGGSTGTVGTGPVGGGAGTSSSGGNAGAGGSQSGGGNAGTTMGSAGNGVPDAGSINKCNMTADPAYGLDCNHYCNTFLATCKAIPTTMGVYTDRPDCQAKCQAFSQPVICCRAYMADNAALGQADLHCPHAAGQPPCL